MLSSGTVRMRTERSVAGDLLFDHGGGQHEEVSVSANGRRSAAKSANHAQRKVADGQTKPTESSATWYTGSSRERRSQRCRKKISFRSCGGQLCRNWQREGASPSHTRPSSSSSRTPAKPTRTRTTYGRTEKCQAMNARSVTWES